MHLPFMADTAISRDPDILFPGFLDLRAPLNLT